MDKPKNNIANLPNHIAIIPDGNRRWAKKHALAVYLGHQKGSETLENLLDVLIDFDIPHFSFWGSSQDNLKKRPKEEVAFLLKIFKDQFGRLADDDKIHKNEIRINILGSWKEQFPEDVKQPMERAIENTKNYNKHFFNSFLAYSGTDEMLEATKSIAKLKMKNPDLIINAELLKSQLISRDLPPVDLMIRSGGEPHNSDGFMMWDVANSQLVFSEKLWPDFTNSDLEEAILDYSSRERRLGK
jgi:tritrans,polycis-undecaprenyl-diphosphate synthase [geranylgeranyl-diphosphate specific]